MTYGGIQVSIDSRQANHLNSRSTVIKSGIIVQWKCALLNSPIETSIAF